MKIETIHSKFLECKTLSTDTRNIREQSMFFALKGANFDANSFADEALAKGAKYVVIDNTNYYKDTGEYILVDDVLTCLQKLASYHRKQLQIPIIALTGSNGKTTTKELINAVLSQRFQTTATVGNLNNHIGVPLTLLSMTQQTEIGIVEMGANHFKEIELLCKIANPNFGYITNFGKAHLEGFGSIAGVIKAKSELYEYLKENDGLAFVNPDDKVQLTQTNKQKRQFIGQTIEPIESQNFIKVKWQEMSIQSNLVGNYNYPNIVAAICIGAYFGVSKEQIKAGIESYTPVNKRSQIITKNNITILLDAYNANPTSMQAALENFGKNSPKNKIVILGDMFELGESALHEHVVIAKLAQSYGFDRVILIGNNFGKTNLKDCIYFKNYTDFEAGFDKQIYTNKTLLIKGSRGMALERIVKLFD